MQLQHCNFNSKSHIKSKVTGVTLIELLVVITIMMTLMSLVAPIAIKTIDKAQAQSEFISFCGTLRKASIKAFANGKRIQVVLESNKLTAFDLDADNNLNPELNQNANTILLELEYKYLTFTETNINFNKNGMANLLIINLKQLNTTRSIDLLKLLES